MGTQHLCPASPIARGSAWAGGRDHTPSRVPQRWGTTSCRETAPLTYLVAVREELARAEVVVRVGDPQPVLAQPLPLACRLAAPPLTCQGVAHTADGKHLCCRPETPVKLLWPAVNPAWPEKIGRFGPKQAYIASPNRQWQSPGRYHKKLPISPGYTPFRVQASIASATADLKPAPGG